MNAEKYRASADDERFLPPSDGRRVLRYSDICTEDLKLSRRITTEAIWWPNTAMEPVVFIRY